MYSPLCCNYHKYQITRSARHQGKQLKFSECHWFCETFLFVDVCVHHCSLFYFSPNISELAFPMKDDLSKTQQRILWQLAVYGKFLCTWHGLHLISKVWTRMSIRTVTYFSFREKNWPHAFIWLSDGTFRNSTNSKADSVLGNFLTKMYIQKRLPILTLKFWNALSGTTGLWKWSKFNRMQELLFRPACISI